VVMDVMRGDREHESHSLSEPRAGDQTSPSSPLC
jgi:hypothetical protein